MTSTAAESPSKEVKKGIKWNNVFASGHRRSRSWTGLNKAIVAEAMQSSTSLGALPTRDTDALVTTTPSYGHAIEEEDEDRAPLSTSVSPKSSVIAIPPSRPKPAPRLWTEPSAAENSLPGLETVIAPSPVQFHPIQTTLPVGLRPGTPSAGKEVKTLASKFSSRSNEGTLSMRRKGSVADLDLGKVEKVRHATEMVSVLRKSFSLLSYDSSPVAEIPAPRGLRNERKISKALTPPKDCLTPRPVASDPQLSETGQDMEPALKTPVWDERSQRRASSMLLPLSLAPLVVPSMPPRTPPIPPLDPLKTDLSPAVATSSPGGSSTQQLIQQVELPPKVPPKSPRTLLRAFPIPRPSVTSSGTPSTSHTANSSISSISPIETPLTALTNAAWSPLDRFPSPARLAAQGESPTVPVENSTQQVESGSATSMHKGATRNAEGKTTEAALTFLPRNAFSGKHVKSSRSNSSLAGSTIAIVSGATQAQRQHQRMTSESSVMNRGRPMRRGDASLQRGISRGLKGAAVDGSFAELPTGYKKGHVTQAVMHDELRGLRRDAEEQASGYEVLARSQIADLDQELRILDEHQEQFRQTISRLREGRRGILSNMRLCLDDPSKGPSLRDQVSKQEAALRDIDDSVDEWTSKMEAAVDRKQLIQAKLSQHLAAVLAMPDFRGENGRLSDEQTPPRSPERNMGEQIVEEAGFESLDDEKLKREVESITIYADSGVASLLRSIEQEIDQMDQRRHASE